MAVEESEGKKMKYPKSVFFIILNEFCERFSYYGMRACLSMYFVDILLYNEKSATFLFHIFTMFAYFFPLVGAMIADSWLGKFRTIFYLSIIYALGQLLLSVSSVPSLNLPVRQITILGLFLIAFGTGGIKPCVAAFGGDQFKLPEQEGHMSSFFSLFYMAINTGSLISMFITPILRRDIKCLGRDSCFQLAFLVPCILMTLSIVIFVAGKRMYKMKKPEGNIVFKVASCITHAIGRKIKTKSVDKRDHWLDYADDSYDRKLIEDIKSVLKVLKLFIPLPIFWALYDQQGSRWTFQAARMDSKFFGYTLIPEQMQVVNPFFIIVFIPIFQFVLWPIFEKFLFLNTPLRKMTVGGILTALSFIISALVEYSIESTYAPQSLTGIARVKIFNTIPCDVNVTLEEHQFVLQGLTAHQSNIPVNDTDQLNLEVNYENCKYLNDPNFTLTRSIEIVENKVLSWTLTKNGLSEVHTDNVDGTKNGAKVRTLFYLDPSTPSTTMLMLSDGTRNYSLGLNDDVTFTPLVDIAVNVYNLKLDGRYLPMSLNARYGCVYTVVGYVSKEYTEVQLFVDTEPAYIHIIWLLPQYIVITMGEIMFSITGVEFAFTQAPVSMKSLLQAGWLLTVAFGNLIVAVITEAHFFDRQVHEFFLFAGLMIIDMLIFAVMAKYYKYVELDSSDNSTSDEIDLKETKEMQCELNSADH